MCDCADWTDYVNDVMSEVDASDGHHCDSGRKPGMLHQADDRDEGDGDRWRTRCCTADWGS